MSENVKDEKDKTLEELFAELDGILDAIEKDGVPLEDAFSLYEKGVAKIKICNEKLDMVEKKMQILSGESEDETL